MSRLDISYETVGAIYTESHLAYPVGHYLVDPVSVIAVDCVILCSSPKKNKHASRT